MLQGLFGVRVGGVLMVRVKLFANFREAVGKGEIKVSADDVSDLLKRLVEMYPSLKKLVRDGYVNVAVNGEIVCDYNIKLRDDDVVAIFPPVSGG